MLQSNGSSEATVKGFRNSSISVDTVFPMGTKVDITNIDVDTVKFDATGAKTVVTATPQLFCVTNISDTIKNGEGVTYTNIILVSSLMKSYRVRQVDAGKTDELRATLKASADEALRGNLITAEQHATQIAAAMKATEYKTVQVPRNQFAEDFHKVYCDWDATLHPEIAGYSECAGRTYEATGKRLLAYIKDGGGLISLKQATNANGDIVIFAEKPADDSNLVGYDVVNYDKSVNTGRWLTVWARQKDWEEFQSK